MNALNDPDYPILRSRRLGAPNGSRLASVEVNGMDVFREPDGSITIRPRDEGEVILRDDDDVEWLPAECVFARDEDMTE